MSDSNKTGKRKLSFNVGAKAEVGDISESFHDWTGQKEQTRLIPFNQLITDHNPYSLTDIEDLVNSICQYGLEQNLVVKRSENTFKEYTVKTGHRRYAAIKYILENLNTDGKYDELLNIYCRVIEPEENEILVHLRLHETNLQVRSLLKMPHEEKIAVIEDYLKWLKLARDQNLEINGQLIKGKTRDILAERFGISTGKAGQLIAEVKERQEGARNGTPKEKPKLTAKKISKSFEKLMEMMDQLIEENTLDDTEKMDLKETIKNLQEVIDMRFRVYLIKKNSDLDE